MGFLYAATAIRIRLATALQAQPVPFTALFLCLYPIGDDSMYFLRYWLYGQHLNSPVSICVYSGVVSRAMRVRKINPSCITIPHFSPVAYIVIIQVDTANVISSLHGRSKPNNIFTELVFHFTHSPLVASLSPAGIVGLM